MPRNAQRALRAGPARPACDPAHRTNAGRVPSDRQGSVHSTTPGVNDHSLSAPARRDRLRQRCFVRVTACEPAWDSKSVTGLRRVRIGQGAEIAFLGPWEGKVKCAAPTFHFFRKSSWYATEGLQHHKTPIRCPWSRQSRTNSSPGPCTPCGTNPCNLVYIWGRPNRQRRNAAPTRDRGDGSQTACTPRMRIPHTPKATSTNQRRSEC